MENLTKETLELINKTAVEAAGAENKTHIFTHDDDPDHVFYIGKADGTYDRIEAEADPEDNTLESLDQVGPLVHHLDGSELNPIVWFSAGRVYVVHDKDVRRARSVLVLSKTPELRDLIKIGDHAYTQPEMVRMLRLNLRACLPDERLLQYVREASFEGNRGSTGSVQHGRESMGQEIHAAAVNPEECPETIDLSVRIFDDPDLLEKWAVRCDVEILVADEKFRITPLPLELKNAIDKEVGAIGVRLEGDCPDGVPIFRGSPG